MIRNYPGENWKPVLFDFEYVNDFRLEVSNFGRVRTFNKLSDGNLIKGSMINGYRIVRLKFFSKRDEKVQAALDDMKQQVFKLARQLKLQRLASDVQAIDETASSLESLKKKLSKKFKQDVRSRTTHYHSLIHRFVADYFLPKPTEGATIVAHLNFDKLDNKATNLKWMTPEENYAHQKNSPHVIKDIELRQERQQSNPKRAKLTVTRVMLMKKLLSEGKTVKQMAKLFKVSDTQVLRIKRGENWANIS